MRDVKRIKRILKLLEELWNKPQNQDMRLGQLLENYVFGRGVMIWFKEDDDTEDILKKTLKEMI